MFKFNFSTEDHEIEEKTQVKDVWNECEEIIHEPNILVDAIIRQVQINSVAYNNNEIKYFRPKEIVKFLGTQQYLNKFSVLKAEGHHSDLLPAVYEGGLKIWECTYDLFCYINDCNVDFTNKKILDLGCGAGIIGIFLLLKGANCWFQDYNSDVIQFLTIPNIILNSKNGMKDCKFYSGDWESFAETVGVNVTEDVNKCDYIMTSETIYNTESYEKLHKVFEKLLKKSGVIFLAAKSFYFGVGGGISLFQEFLDKQNIFKYTTCWKCEEGLKREILKIEFL